MTSEQSEVRVRAVFDYWDAYVGGEKIETDGLKRHTRTDVINRCLKLVEQFFVKTTLK